MLPNSVQSPLFRKAILPWYDTDAACILTGVFMLIVFAFSFTGIAVAFETPESCRHVWVPCALLVLSAGVITSVVFRLSRRHTH